MWPVTALNSSSEYVSVLFVHRLEARAQHASCRANPSCTSRRMPSSPAHFLSPAERFCAKLVHVFFISFSVPHVKTELYEIDLYFRFLLPSFFANIVVNIDRTQRSSLLQKGLESVVLCLRSSGLPSSCAVHIVFICHPELLFFLLESMQLL